MPVLWNKLRWFGFRLLSLVSTIFFLPSNGNNGRNQRLILILKQTVVANLELKSKILRVDCCVEFVARIQVSYKLQNTKMNKYFNDFFWIRQYVSFKKQYPKYIFKVLFTVRYTKRQITAFTFLPLQKQLTKKGKAEFSDFKG